MKKKTFLFVQTVLLVLVFAILTGCGKKSASSTQSGSEKITLRVLNYYDMSSANSEEAIKVIWDKFLSDNPGIAIEREDLANEPYHQKLEAYIAAGQIPDVMYAWPAGRSTNLQNNHLLKDITPFLQKDNLSRYYVKDALDPAIQGAGYVAELAWATSSTHALFVNKALLRECGLEPAKTYAELKAQVPVLKAKGFETIIMANQEPWVLQSCLFSLIAGRFCGPGWTDRIIAGEAKFTDADFTAALDFLKTMFDDGVLAKTTLGVDYGGAPGLFANRQSAYYVDGDWRVGAFITDQSTGRALFSPRQQEDILITVFPDIPGAKINKSTSWMLSSGWGMSASIPAGSPKEDAAWRLVKWLTGQEIQSYELSIGGLSTPTRTDIDMSALQLEPMQKAIASLPAQYTATTKVIDDAFHSDVYNPLNDALLQIGAGARTPQQAARDIQRAFDTWKANR